MQVTLTVPDELLAVITRANGDPCRTALEAMALTAYRERQIDTGQLRTILGISSNVDLEEFLRLHQLEIGYSRGGPTLGDLAASEFAGIWRDRADIDDSFSFARRLRDEAWRRSE